ncbi:hypothetical protein HDU76_009074, partial [Blyttiomyces sp. JEL0837]
MVVGETQWKPYDQLRINSIAIRSSAMTLNCVNIFLWAQTFKNKKSAVALMSLAFIIIQQIGVIVQSIDTFNGYAGKPIYIRDKLLIWVGVGCFNLQSELFNWTLYLRFKALINFNTLLNKIVLVLLTLESLAFLTVTTYWSWAAGVGNFPARVTSAQVQEYITYYQAANAFLLTGFFLIKFYYPKLKILRGTRLFTKFFSTGFVYLFLESILGLGYSLGFRISPEYS